MTDDTQAFVKFKSSENVSDSDTGIEMATWWLEGHRQNDCHV